MGRGKGAGARGGERVMRLEEVAAVAEGGRGRLWRKWKRKRKEADEEGWRRRQRGCRWVRARWGLKFGTAWGRGGEAVEQEKGRRGWVIYFPPARHNLSRGFSREHAESTAIEEELGGRGGRAAGWKVAKGRVGTEKGWKKGGHVGGGGGVAAATPATRSGHQETDVNGGKVYVLRMLVPRVRSSLTKGPSIYGRLQPPRFRPRISNRPVNDSEQPDAADVRAVANVPFRSC